MAINNLGDLQKIIDTALPVSLNTWQLEVLRRWMEADPPPPLMRPRIHGPRVSHVIIDEIHKMEQP